MKAIVLTIITLFCCLAEPAFAERFLPRGNKPNNVFGVRNYRQQGMTGMRGNRNYLLGRRTQGRSLYGFRSRNSTLSGVRRSRTFFGSLRFR